MKILEAKVTTTVTLELTQSDQSKLNTIIEALYIVLNEGEFKAALDDGNLTLGDIEAADEAIEWLRELRDVTQ